MKLRLKKLNSRGFGHIELFIVVAVIAAIGFTAFYVSHYSSSEANAAIRTVTPTTTSSLLFDSNKTGNFEIYSSSLTGTNIIQLTNNSTYDSWWPQPSPNGSEILFYRDPKGIHDTNPVDNSLWEMNANGTNVHELLAAGAYGWGLQGHAVWSPNGSQIVMFGGPYGNPQIFITNGTGGNPRQITNRGGTNIDPSWSPSGNQIAFIGCAQSVCYPTGYSVYTMNSNGTNLVRLTNNGYENNDPYYSPSGNQIAWLSNTGGTYTWSILIMNSNGTKQGAVIDDGNLNSKPAWSTNGQLIYFHRLVLGQTVFGIYSITPSGTNLTPIIVNQYSNEYPMEMTTTSN